MLSHPHSQTRPQSLSLVQEIQTLARSMSKMQKANVKSSRASPSPVFPPSSVLSFKVYHVDADSRRFRPPVHSENSVQWVMPPTMSETMIPFQTWADPLLSCIESFPLPRRNLDRVNATRPSRKRFVKRQYQTSRSGDRRARRRRLAPPVLKKKKVVRCERPSFRHKEETPYVYVPPAKRGRFEPRPRLVPSRGNTQKQMKVKVAALSLAQQAEKVQARLRYQAMMSRRHESYKARLEVREQRQAEMRAMHLEFRAQKRIRSDAFWRQKGVDRSLFQQTPFERKFERLQMDTEAAEHFHRYCEVVADGDWEFDPKEDQADWDYFRRHGTLPGPSSQPRPQSPGGYTSQSFSSYDW